MNRDLAGGWLPSRTRVKDRRVPQRPTPLGARILIAVCDGLPLRGQIASGQQRWGSHQVTRQSGIGTRGQTRSRRGNLSGTQ